MENVSMTPPPTPIIRRAVADDLAAMTAIYNEAIPTTTATFDTQPKSVTERQSWFEAHQTARHPIMVAEQAGRVVGWASLSQWSPRPAYADTAEISIYVAAPQRGQGLGKRLMAVTLEAGQTAGLHTVLARVAGGNAGSIRLHEQFGFQLVGVMREVGFKFGQRLDIHLMQMLY